MHYLLILAELQGGVVKQEVPKVEVDVEGEEVNVSEAPMGGFIEGTTESIYGVDIKNLEKLIQSDGFISAEEMAETGDRYGVEADRKFKRAEVRLFDRVLSGDATEEEMKIAIDHAVERAKNYGITAFKSAIPRAWYTNDRIADALAGTSLENKKWVSYVKENYSNEELKKEYREINEDGSVSTYTRK